MTDRAAIKNSQAATQRQPVREDFEVLGLTSLGAFIVGLDKSSPDYARSVVWSSQGRLCRVSDQPERFSKESLWREFAKRRAAFGIQRFKRTVGRGFRRLQ